VTSDIPSTAIPASGKKPVVLIVDDESAARKTLEMMLEGLYDVHIADSGARAMELFTRCCADIVLLDIMMPGMDGIETLRVLRNALVVKGCLLLRSLPGPCRTSVKMISEAGFDAYIAKPVHETELIDSIRMLVNQDSQTER
jgi:CheY-like chemotaxis protein